ncbi:MAG: nitric oxide reductase activation protein [Eubacteriales bacterium]|nr:nitric oxide reductase activation protein [Eubacteriales bacterium]
MKYDYNAEENRMEIENRIRNLMWTISGDYDLDVKPDVEAFARNKYIALYDAVKQGAFARYFDMNAFSLYIIKKLYYGAEEGPLMGMAQLCVDAAGYPALVKDRPGVKGIRRKAFEAMLEHDFHRLNQSFAGRVKLSFIRDALDGRRRDEKRIQEVKDCLYSLEGASDTMEIIRMTDFLYNKYVDAAFERKHGNLEHVLAVELQEIVQDGWQDFLDEEMYESVMEQFLEQVNQQVTTLEELQEEKEEKKKRGGKRIVVLDEKAIARMHTYMELNFGRSCLTDMEQERMNRRLCTGAHENCSLYYTEGILADPVLSNAQYVNAKKQSERNRLLYHNSKSIVKHNIDVMTASLRRALTLRTEVDEIPSEFGAIVPNRLWRIGRTDTSKMFTRIIKQNNSDFVVDILIDASGSQRDRQSQVALQAYIISRALSNAAIPHRVMGFCTFWDYTVMQRYREYDSPASADERIFEYNTSANNRDGLAIRAAADSLAQREEDNKILIVLSDGRPNDVIVNRPNSRNPKIYCGDYAVQDTAQEVRKVRNAGIFVLGVFAGKDADLAAEKTIFGKDFAYIRDIRNFSAVVSQYLQKLLDW